MKQEQKPRPNSILSFETKTPKQNESEKVSTEEGEAFQYGAHSEGDPRERDGGQRIHNSTFSVASKAMLIASQPWA